MHRLLSIVLLCCFAVPPLDAAADALDVAVDRVDRILVVKSERKMYLQSAGRTLRTFDISLGLVPEGAKQREGDFRTPEGVYYIEAKNARSDFFLALKVSYPNEQDRARARANGIDPGGQIMIHGQPNRSEGVV